jgi:hypothetical protein
MEPAPAQPMFKRFALEQLHHEKWLALVFADIVDSTDVRMIDARRAARFSPESLENRGIGRQVLRQQC